MGARGVKEDQSPEKGRGGSSRASREESEGGPQGATPRSTKAAFWFNSLTLIARHREMTQVNDSGPSPGCQGGKRMGEYSPHRETRLERLEATRLDQEEFA